MNVPLVCLMALAKMFQLIGNAIGAITEHNPLFQDWMLETAIFFL